MKKRKHALIITAYQEFDYLETLCRVYSLYFDCYVHIDKKSPQAHKAVEKLNQLKNVFAISQYQINWGSYKHILAILALLQKAVEDEIEFFHIISANTILIKNPQKLMEFFEKEPERVYMEVKKNTGQSFYEFDYRYTAYFFQHVYDLKGENRSFWEKVEKWGSAFQRKIKLRSGIHMDYKGYVYCHLPRQVVLYILSYVKQNPQYIKELKYCSIGEEFFFQNIIMGSKYASEVINDPLIYDEWGERGNPAFLDMTDIDKLCNTNAFFARKVSEEHKKVFEVLRRKEGF